MLYVCKMIQIFKRVNGFILCEKTAFAYHCLADVSSTLNKFKSYCGVITLEETAHVRRQLWPVSLCLNARSLVGFVLGGEV